MARSIWSGAISFGLVNVPIKLYSAVSRKTVRFNQLNAETGNRIQQKRLDPETGEEVPYDKIVKGFELTKEWFTDERFVWRTGGQERIGEERVVLEVAQHVGGGHGIGASAPRSGRGRWGPLSRCPDGTG